MGGGLLSGTERVTTSNWKGAKQCCHLVWPVPTPLGTGVSPASHLRPLPNPEAVKQSSWAARTPSPVPPPSTNAGPQAAYPASKTPRLAAVVGEQDALRPVVNSSWTRSTWLSPGGLSAGKGGLHVPRIQERIMHPLGDHVFGEDHASTGISCIRGLRHGGACILGGNHASTVGSWIRGDTRRIGLGCSAGGWGAAIHALALRCAQASLGCLRLQGWQASPGASGWVGCWRGEQAPRLRLPAFRCALHGRQQQGGEAREPHVHPPRSAPGPRLPPPARLLGPRPFPCLPPQGGEVSGQRPACWKHVGLSCLLVVPGSALSQVASRAGREGRVSGS